MNNILIIERRLAICRTCESHVYSGHSEQCVQMMSDCTGPVCTQKLQDAIRRGICPLGKFDAVNMEARR